MGLSGCVIDLAMLGAWASCVMRNRYKGLVYGYEKLDDSEMGSWFYGLLTWCLTCRSIGSYGLFCRGQKYLLELI